MSWVINFNPVTSLETAALAANKPIVIGYSAADGARPKWSQGSGVFTDPDVSAAGAPAWLACNRSAADRTYPNAAAVTSWLVFGFGADVELDCLGLIGTNLAEIDPDAGVEVTVEIADDVAFTTNLTTIANWTQFSARHLELFADRTFGTGFLRVAFYSTLGAFVPEIGECWFGRRRQLRGFFRAGRDARGVASMLAMSSAESSAQGASPMAIGRLDLPVAIQLNDAESLMTDTASVRRWWTEADEGTSPFLWCREPLTAPDEFVVMTTSATVLSLPKPNGPYARVLEQQWTEMPPFLAAE